MGMTTGLVALALLGAEPPWNVVQDTGIACEVQVVTVEGLGWRDAAYSRLKPAARQGSATVWTADRELKAKLEQACVSGRSVKAPKVSANPEAVATVNSDRVQDYISHVDRISDGPINAGTMLAFHPEVGTIREGFNAVFAGRRLDQGVLAKVKVTESHVGTLHTIQLHERVAAAPVAPPAAVTVAEVGRTVVQALGAKPADLATTVQVPEVYLSQVEGEWFVPNDGILLISMGVNTVADAQGKAVVHERLAILDFARPCDEANCTASYKARAEQDVAVAQAACNVALAMPAVPDRSTPEAVDADGKVCELPPLPEAYASADLNRIAPGTPSASPQTVGSVARTSPETPDAQPEAYASADLNRIAPGSPEARPQSRVAAVASGRTIVDPAPRPDVARSGPRPRARRQRRDARLVPGPDEGDARRRRPSHRGRRDERALRRRRAHHLPGLRRGVVPPQGDGLGGRAVRRARLPGLRLPVLRRGMRRSGSAGHPPRRQRRDGDQRQGRQGGLRLQRRGGPRRRPEDPRQARGEVHPARRQPVAGDPGPRRRPPGRPGEALIGPAFASRSTPASPRSHAGRPGVVALRRSDAPFDPPIGRARPMDETHQAHIAAASLNQTVGDWAGNERRIRDVIEAARATGARLLLLPEMCLPGYSLGDRLFRTGTIERSWDMLQRLKDATRGMAVAIGLPVQYEGVVYNAMALLADGQLVGLAAKENLATGDVQYENRYFLSWPHGRLVDFRGPDGTTVPFGTQMFHLPGLGTVAFEICEDAWKGLRPGSTYALAGAEILLNPSASWFTIGKHRTRRKLVEQISRADHCVYLYTSLAGCDATRLIFDGSLFIAVDGRVEAEGRRFVFERDWELVDRVVDLREIRHSRMEEGSWREQNSRATWGAYGKAPGVVRVEGDFSTRGVAAAPPPYWIPRQPDHPDPSLRYLEDSVFGGRAITEMDLSHVELEVALAMALRDYTRKSGIKTCCLALSGGRDSAMVAWLVRQMHRYSHPHLSRDELADHVRRRFLCAYLATENSGPQTRAAARAVAEEFGARFHDGNVQPALSAAHHVVESMTGEALSWRNPEHDVTMQNIQARVRGMLIWTLANLENALLLVTSNKSEAAVGYTTMDGDSSGGLAPISDVPKSLIKLYLDWAADFHGLKSLQMIKGMEATAELRPQGSGQTDETDLMPFQILDQLMYAFVQLALDPREILIRFWPAVREHYKDDLREVRRRHPQVRPPLLLRPVEARADRHLVPRHRLRPRPQDRLPLPPGPVPLHRGTRRDGPPRRGRPQGPRTARRPPRTVNGR